MAAVAPLPELLLLLLLGVEPVAQVLAEALVMQQPLQPAAPAQTVRVSDAVCDHGERDSMLMTEGAASQNTCSA